MSLVPSRNKFGLQAHDLPPTLATPDASRNSTRSSRPWNRKNNAVHVTLELEINDFAKRSFIDFTIGK